MSDLSQCRIGCITCKKPLVNLQESGNQPRHGLEFVTVGHYGSAVFDPMDGTRLIINLCDDCLIDGADRGHVLRAQPRPAPNEILEEFKP